MIIIIVLLLSSLSSVCAQSPDGTSNRTIKFVYSQNIFQDATVNDAEAISTVLSEYIASSYNLVSSNTKHVVNVIEEFDNLLNDKTDLFILLGTEYLQLSGEGVLVPKYSLQANNDIGFEYIVLVNKNSKIGGIKDLKNKSIGIMAKQSISPTYQFVQYTVHNFKDKKSDSFFESIKLNTKANSLILSVFFNELDACVISTESFSLISELNPQIKDNLKIIARSPRLLTGLICFNKKIIGTEKEKISNDILSNLHNNDYGKQLLNLFSIERLIPFKENHLKSLEKIIDGLKK